MKWFLLVLFLALFTTGCLKSSPSGGGYGGDEFSDDGGSSGSGEGADQEEALTEEEIVAADVVSRAKVIARKIEIKHGLSFSPSYLLDDSRLEYYLDDLSEGLVAGLGYLLNALDSGAIKKTDYDSYYMSRYGYSYRNGTPVSRDRDDFRKLNISYKISTEALKWSFQFHPRYLELHSRETLDEMTVLAREIEALANIKIDVSDIDFTSRYVYPLPTLWTLKNIKKFADESDKNKIALGKIRNIEFSNTTNIFCSGREISEFNEGCFVAALDSSEFKFGVNETSMFIVETFPDRVLRHLNVVQRLAALKEKYLLKRITIHSRYVDNVSLENVISLLENWSLRFPDAFKSIEDISISNFTKAYLSYGHKQLNLSAYDSNAETLGFINRLMTALEKGFIEFDPSED